MGGVLGACMERRPGKPAASSSTELVLADDDLLREVLLRLADPGSLVRAACVSRRWLRVASSPRFLRDFRELHPPRLLGSFPTDPGTRRCRRPKLLPCRRLPSELSAMARRANGYLSQIWLREFGNYEVLDSRNGRLLFYVTDISDPVRLGIMICAPLRPAAPPVYLPLDWAGTTYRGADDNNGDVQFITSFEFLPEDGGDGLSYFEVRVVKRRSSNADDVVFATVVSCQAGIEGECQATPSIKLPNAGLRWSSCSRLGLLCGGGKFYVLTKHGYILGLDLVAMTLFYIYLPEEVVEQDGDATEYDYLKNIELSRGEGSKFYVVYIKGLKVFVWLYDAERGGNASDDWMLVDTICLLQVFAKHDLASGGCRVHLLERSGDNAEFVYLRILDTAEDSQRADYLLHVKSRAVEKVLEKDGHTASMLYPFTMVWPPAFPALNDEDDHGHVEL